MPRTAPAACCGPAIRDTCGQLGFSSVPVEYTEFEPLDATAPRRVVAHFHTPATLQLSSGRVSRRRKPKEARRGGLLCLARICAQIADSFRNFDRFAVSRGGNGLRNNSPSAATNTIASVCAAPFATGRLPRRVRCTPPGAMIRISSAHRQRYNAHSPVEAGSFQRSRSIPHPACRGPQLTCD